MTDGMITLGLSGILFAIGSLGVAIRRNPLIMFMCIELMLNAANLALATFSHYYSQSSQGVSEKLEQSVPAVMGSAADGSVFVFLVMTIAAAEAAVGLAIIIAIFRTRKQVDADELSELKG